MLPLILGALAGGAMGGFSMLTSMAPGASNAIGAVVTPEITRAKQRNFKASPTLQIAAGDLVTARLKGLITDEYFKSGMAENGLTSDKANILYETSRQLLSIEELGTAYYKGDINADTYYKKALRLGFNKEEASLYITQKRSALDAETLVNDLWRGHINDATYYKKMYENGYTREDATLLLKAQYFIPSHEDLIRFQVRDVYNSGIVEKYGYDEDFPESILPDAAKIGMDKETMLKYWRAHWETVSPTMLYEMLHRLHPEVLAVTAPTYDYPPEFMKGCETTPEIIEEQLKIADYPKYWRNRLMAISYHSLTRVDLKRVYKLGLIDDDYVIATLREDGYAKYDATKLLEFFKADKQGKEKKLSQTQLLNAYNYGYVSKNDLINELREMNYTDEDISLVMAVNKQKLEEKDLKDLITVWQAEYINGTLEINIIKEKLTKKGISDKRADLILAKMLQAKRKSLKTPPLQDLHKFYTKGLLDEAKYKQALHDSGIKAEYIDLYAKMNNPNPT